MIQYWLHKLHGRLYNDMIDGSITALVIAFAAVIGWLVLLIIIWCYDHV